MTFRFTWLSFGNKALGKSEGSLVYIENLFLKVIFF